MRWPFSAWAPLAAGFLVAVLAPAFFVAGFLVVVFFFVAIVQSPSFENHRLRCDHRNATRHQLPRVGENIQRILKRFSRFRGA